MNIIEKRIDEIIPYEKNPRRNDKAVTYVVNSIKQFGFKVPLVIDKDNVIVCGHTRWKAAKRLKMKKLPCVIADDLTEEQIRAFRLADNKVAEIADWNVPLLNEEIEDLKDYFDFSDFGFDFNDSDYFEDEAEAKEDGYVAEIPKNPKAKIGDVYILGNHRLMCGDSTKEEDVERLMDGQKADMVFTDPPYNVALGIDETVEEAKKRHRRTDGLTIKNDKMDNGEFEKFLMKFYKNASDALKAGGVIYVCHGDGGEKSIHFRKCFVDAGLLFKESLVWCKNTFVFGRQDYHWQHENILYGWKKGGPHSFYGGRNQGTVIPENFPVVITDDENGNQIIDIHIGLDVYSLKASNIEVIDNTNANTALYFNKPSRNGEHPTMKPVGLVGRCIKNSSKEKENVLDLFGGSGSTLIACEQLHRNCFMMEYDPKYIDVIIDRWEKFTGQKAVKIA